jgi:hypothetical protein
MNQEIIREGIRNTGENDKREAAGVTRDQILSS